MAPLCIRHPSCSVAHFANLGSFRREVEHRYGTHAGHPFAPRVANVFFCCWCCCFVFVFFLIWGPLKPRKLWQAAQLSRVKMRSECDSKMGTCQRSQINILQTRLFSCFLWKIFNDSASFLREKKQQQKFVAIISILLSAIAKFSHQCVSSECEWYQSLAAHQHQKDHTVPKQV